MQQSYVHVNYITDTDNQTTQKERNALHNTIYDTKEYQRKQQTARNKQIKSLPVSQSSSQSTN
jgi:hypothetical protein